MKANIQICSKCEFAVFTQSIGCQFDSEIGWIQDCVLYWNSLNSLKEDTKFISLELLKELYPEHDIKNKDNKLEKNYKSVCDVPDICPYYLEQSLFYK